MQPFVIGTENGALERLIDDVVELAHRAGKQNLSFDAINILVFEPCRGLPAAGIIFVAKIFVEANRLDMFFLVHFGNALFLAHDLSL